MRFFFPDSQDQIDPSFDFQSEQRSAHRVRQRDDRYAHEVLSPAPYDGMLISKPIVDGLPGTSGKYTVAQRNRLYRQGAHSFFRLDHAGTDLTIMGDCGAFTYAKEETPVYTVDEVIDFYEGCGLDAGLAMDHVIFGYDRNLDSSPDDVPPDWKRRQELTLRLAGDFLQACDRRRVSFEPVGVAHGWSPESYADSVARLQGLGYNRLALGGMVPLKTPDIVASLETVAEVLNSKTELHLLGVTRTGYVRAFSDFGVTSFDSTSPFRQSFKDDKDNYYAGDRTYVAIRIPQVDGNTSLRKLVTAGIVDQRDARQHEKECLKRVRQYGDGTGSAEDAVKAVRRYGELIGEKKDRSEKYLETLRDRPWESCGCAVCKDIGVEVILFRGAERNRRRGFHNLSVFAERLERGLAPSAKNRTAQ